MGGFFMRNIEYLKSSIEDTNIISIAPVKPPIQLKTEIINRSPDLVANTRQEIRDILHGQDTKRLLMVHGPCSVHDPETALEYAGRSVDLKRRFEDDLLIVMRTYFEKPRTTVGWTGLVYDPHLDGSSDAITGLAVSRQLLVDINSLGLPCAVEILDPITPQYFADLVSWGAVGARTTESQIHRQLVSGLSMPIGFKNSTEGNNNIAFDAMIAASSSHTFFGIDIYGRAAVVKTAGNPDTHIVLRGSNKDTNYSEESIKDVIDLMQKRDLLTEASRPIMVDCSHGNSKKDYEQQPEVVKNVLEQIKSGQQRIMGMMIESNLQAGQQKWSVGQKLQHGVSITDGCINWEETERLLEAVAKAVKSKKYLGLTLKI